MTTRQPHPQSTTTLSTDAAAAFALTAPSSGEDACTPKPPPAPGERGRRYKQGCSRGQVMLLPLSVE